MDGQNRTKLVDIKIVSPSGITLDLISKLVYWADHYLDHIEVVDYEGRNRRRIFQGSLVSSCSPALRFWCFQVAGWLPREAQQFKSPGYF